MNILDAVKSKQLFAPWFRGSSWDSWLAFLASLFALPMTDSQAEIYRKLTARTTLPIQQARESWVCVGRRGGKSLIAALVAVFLACFKDYAGILGPGEIATVMVIAADRRQARVILRYINGFFDSVPLLSNLVVRRTKESLELSNRVAIEIHTCNFRAVRGYTIAAALLDEVAFWRSEESANPDSEVVNALRPALSTIPNSLLLAISSPYAKRGALWDAYSRHYGKDGDTLVWQADSLSMNPSINPAIINRAYEEDEASASAEYGAIFRQDLESYVSVESIQRCVRDYQERAFDYAFNYRAFVDVSGGSGSDSYTMAIGHKESDQLIIDAIRETKPPFNPEMVTEQYCELLKEYRISEVRGDRYAGSWPAEQFQKRGIRYLPAEKSKSEIYVDALPLFNAGKVELPDHKKLVKQLTDLERRTGRGTGRDVIDHGPNPNCHDDISNSVCGLLVMMQSVHTRAPGDCGVT